MAENNVQAPQWSIHVEWSLVLSVKDAILQKVR